MADIFAKAFDCGFVTIICCDAWRVAEFKRLCTAVRMRQDVSEDSIIADEVFALGIQMAWLRLSKGEPIVPAEVAANAKHSEAAPCLAG